MKLTAPQRNKYSKKIVRRRKRPLPESRHKIDDTERYQPDADVPDDTPEEEEYDFDGKLFVSFCTYFIVQNIQAQFIDSSIHRHNVMSYERCLEFMYVGLETKYCNEFILSFDV